MYTYNLDILVSLFFFLRIFALLNFECCSCYRQKYSCAYLLKSVMIFFCRKFCPFIELVYQMHTYLHKLPQRWTIIYQCNLEKTMRTTDRGLRRWCIPFHSQCVVMPSKGEREISVLAHFFFHFITVHMLLRFKKIFLNNS